MSNPPVNAPEVAKTNKPQLVDINSMPGTQMHYRNWIGYWLLFVAAVHTLVAFFAFRGDWMAMGHLGLFDTVGTDPQRGMAAFFLLFGFMLALFAQSISALERSGNYLALRKLGWSFSGLCVVGLLLMPSSGFWLVAPALVAILRKR